VADNDNIGSDFYCVDDLTPSMRVISGRLELAHSVARRLITPAAGLFYDVSYGVDTRSWCGRANVGLATDRLVEDEAYKDERVRAAAATVEFISEAEALPDQQGDSLEIELRLVDADGPFDLTLDINEVTVEIVDKP
jgi:hypothetical protein